MGTIAGAAGGSTGERPEASEGHEHAWSGAEFFLEDDHPRFRMRCACGAERSIRAWERYSDPTPVTDDPKALAEG